tara:strand:+ start:190 stop:591 length:402 start_codon:yes stop_codon:yes gene_type:complete
MRNPLFFLLLFVFTSCLVPKKNLMLEQKHVSELINDSTNMALKIGSLMDKNNSLEQSLSLIETGTKELIIQIDSMKIILQNFQIEVDSLMPRLNRASIERDIWRIESIKLKQNIQRLKITSDSLSYNLTEGNH